MQIDDAVLSDMNDANEFVIDDGHVKVEPHGFGVGASRIGGRERLNRLEGQFRSPSYQP